MGIRRTLANAIQANLKADTAITAVVDADNIIVFSYSTRDQGEVMPSINVRPGSIERVQESGRQRIWLVEIIIVVSVDIDDDLPLSIYDVLDVLLEDSDAFVFKNNSSVGGLPTGNMAKLVDESTIDSDEIEIDIENRVVTSEIIAKYTYIQNT